MRILIPFLLLSGCMSMSGSARPDEARLAAELRDRTPGASQACVMAVPGRNLTIGSEDAILYREGSTIWVNRLRAPCLGMRSDRQLVIEPALGSRYCNGDRVRAVDLSTSYSGQVCRLGDFIPYRAR